MKILGTAALLAGAVLLSACGGGSSHPVCKDEKSATEYATKIAGEIQAAAMAGKVDQAKMMEATEQMQKDAAKIDQKDFGAGCKLLDDYKAKLGL
jgi:ABC-type glycerol-3-phosphate transport system substrate-binding protein